MSKWISVKHELPQRGQQIWAGNSTEYFCMTFFEEVKNGGNTIWKGALSESFFSPTHWMPFMHPNFPPKEG